MTEGKDPSGPIGGPPGWMRDLGIFGIIVAEISVSTGIGVGLGYLAWKKWGAPWWVIVLTSLAGLAVAMYRLYLMTRDEMKDGPESPEKGLK